MSSRNVKEIPGVKIKVKANNVLLVPNKTEDGLFLSHGSVDRLTLILDIQEKVAASLQAFTVTNEGQIIARPQQRRYELAVKVKFVGQPITTYPDNQIRLIDVFDDTLIIWEIGLVARDGKFYCRISEQRRQLALQDGRVVCPDLVDWTAFSPYLEKVARGRQLKLGEIFTPAPPTAEVIDIGKRQACSAN